eukprot:gene5420-589_t
MSEANEHSSTSQETKNQLGDMAKISTASCWCSLYLSQPKPVIDNGDMAVPNWFLFAKGMTSLAYDHKTSEWLLNLYDKLTGRMLWMLKLTEKSQILAQDARFLVVKKSSDSRDHIGLLFDNKADTKMFFNSFTMIIRHKEASILASMHPTVSIQNLSNSPESDVGGKSTNRRRGRFLRSLSLIFKRSSKTATEEPEEQPILKVPYAVDQTMHVVTMVNDDAKGDHLGVSKEEKQSCNGKASIHRERRRRGINRSKTLGAESFANIVMPNQCTRNECEKGLLSSTPEALNVHHTEDRFQLRDRLCSKLIGNSLPSYEHAVWLKNRYRRSTSDFQKVNDNIGNGDQPGLCRDSSFARPAKMVTRSHSERVPGGRPRVRVTKDTNENKDKPRAISDGLLRTDRSTECMVDTGHMAKYQRDRKHWASILESDNVMTTDLCVTEL